MLRLENKCPFYPPSAVALLRRTGFFLFSFFFLLIISCTTQPETGSLSGTILLDGETDHSAIIVALYELTTLDPDIVAINQEYPHSKSNV